jgi:putative transposase
MGLQLRNKAPKRRVQAKLREGRSGAVAANEVWAMDFVHDQLFDGRKIRVLTIVDTFTRLSPAIDVRQSYRSADVVATLERAAVETGLPKTIRVDNGPEFVGKDLDLWAFLRGVTLDFSRPGKPTDNAYIESFNGKFRAECLVLSGFICITRETSCELRPNSSSAASDRTPCCTSFRLGDGSARIFKPRHFFVGKSALGGLGAVASDQLLKSAE